MTTEQIYEFLGRGSLPAAIESAAIQIDTLEQRIEALERRLAALERAAQPQALELRTYNVGEAGDLLRLSRSSMNRLIESGALPVVRMGEGARPRLRHVDLVRWLEANRTQEGSP